MRLSSLSCFHIRVQHLKIYWTVLKNFTSGAYAVSNIGTETLTNKTLTSPKINENVALTSTATELNNLHGNMGSWTSFTPTITAGSGTLTTKSATGIYIKIGKIVQFQMNIVITTNGTGATSLVATLPLQTTGRVFTCIGRDGTITGKTVCGFISGTALTMFFYDNSYPGANGVTIEISGTYQSI